MILSATNARLTDESRTVLSERGVPHAGCHQHRFDDGDGRLCAVGRLNSVQGYWGNHMPKQMASRLENRAGSAINPADLADRPKLSDTPSLLLKAYEGKHGEVTARLQADSIEMAAEGYFPTWQNWAPGEWAREIYVIAALLIFFFGIGILILAYLLVVEPDGTLTVTYERRTAAALGSANG